MKRITTLALLLVLAVPAVAHARDPKPGKFRGKSSKGDPMGVGVNDQGNLHDFFVGGVKIKCEDGYTFNTPTKTKRRIKLELGYPVFDGHWNINDDNWDPYGVYLDGDFGPKGAKTTGDFHIATTVSKDHKRKGGFNRKVHCDSGSLNFSLTRQG
jgi:hypothetical protein